MFAVRFSARGSCLLVLWFLSIPGLYGQTTHIPDIHFEQALIALGLDDTQDGLVSTSSIASVKELKISGKNIQDLTGLKDFTALTSLDCSVNKLKSLDISSNKALKRLLCNNNELISLDISFNVELTTLDCSVNRLIDLNTSANTALQTLGCYDNKLTALDVSANTALTHLQCSYNFLTSLKVATNSALEYLYCEENFLTGLDVSGSKELKKLYCYHNNLTSLGFAFNNSLERLYCFENQLTNLDLSSAKILKRLRCGQNKLAGLDVSNNISLEELSCSNNQITSLNLARNVALKKLICSKNRLSVLDVMAVTDLTTFNATSNPDLGCVKVSETQLKSIPNEWKKDPATSYSVGCPSVTNILIPRLEKVLYPNPAFDHFTLDVPGWQGSRLEVYSPSGHMLMSPIILDESKSTIAIDHLSDGLVILKVINGRASETFKLQIERQR